MMDDQGMMISFFVWHEEDGREECKCHYDIYVSFYLKEERERDDVIIRQYRS